ncbi:MAG TPA: methyl-accepting chemotaxis protein [Mycobacteriales bacterium]|nr:methyl-accepting chemotaxis protein [Mycobacteriales bacterium]
MRTRGARIAIPAPRGAPGRPPRPSLPVPRSLAREAAPGSAPPQPAVPAARPRAEPSPTAEYRARLLRIGELVTLGCLLLGTVAATVMVRLHASGPLSLAGLAGWGLLASSSALGLAIAASRPGPRRSRPGWAVMLGLLALHLAGLTGVVASTGGITGPYWVLFVPVVLLIGATVGTPAALSLGALASGGVYVAAWASHTALGGAGMLLIVMPLFPTAGWASSAFCVGARQAARDAAAHRAAIARDIDQLISLLDAVSAGDLTRVPSLPPDSPPETARLAVAFADTLLSLRRLTRRLAGVGGQLAASSGEVLRTAQGHADAVQHQHEAVRETASTMEQLAGTASVIAETAVRVADCARDTMAHVDAGTSAIQEAGVAMDAIAVRVDDITARARSLAERTRQIGVILAGIDALAVRTNRLALGAAIEAARAGEHGGGFRFVATEIRRLAERSREVTAEARRSLETVAGEADGTVRMGEGGAVDVAFGADRAALVALALRDVATEAAGTVAAAAEIALATRQQQVAADGVASAMVQLGTTSASYQEGSQRYLSSAGQLRALAEELRESLTGFKVA